MDENCRTQDPSLHLHSSYEILSWTVQTRQFSQFHSCFNTKGLLYIPAVYHSINHGIAGVYSTCVKRQNRQQIKGKSQDTGSCASVCIQKSWVGNIEAELWLMIQPEIMITEAPWCLFAPGRGCASLSWPLRLYVAKRTVWNWVLCLKCQWSVQFYAECIVTAEGGNWHDADGFCPGEYLGLPTTFGE